jgi:hypothetical protein
MPPLHPQSAVLVFDKAVVLLFFQVLNGAWDTTKEEIS